MNNFLEHRGPETEKFKNYSLNIIYTKNSKYEFSYFQI